MIIPFGILNIYPNGSRLSIFFHLFGEWKEQCDRVARGECRCAFRFGKFKCAVGGNLDADFSILT